MSATQEVVVSTMSRSKVEPWGELEYVPIVISPPLDFVTEVTVSNELTPWCFLQTSRAQLESELSALDLAPQHLAELMDRAREDASLEGYRIVPRRDIVEGLSPAARARLYHSLGRSPLNPPQNNAFRFWARTLEGWFENAGLSEETVALLSPYVYHHGNFLFFADWELVLPRIASALERRRLVSALARELTMLVKLRVPIRSSVDGLLAYWGRGHRNKDIRPILESLTLCRQPQVIDVVHLLPPFARRLLYTYPPPATSDRDASRDCHWSSLNFFREIPDDSFAELDVVRRTIETQYERLHEPAGFGDLALFCEPHGEVFHSAIYIADDVLFTKNGPTMLRPWMFMKLEQLREFYPHSGPIEVRFFRQR